jgi:hypothetical protein
MLHIRATGAAGLRRSSVAGEVDGVTPSGGPATPVYGSDKSVGAPRFNVVIRGHDRQQVDDDIFRLQRLINVIRRGLAPDLARVRGELDEALRSVRAQRSPHPYSRPVPR